MSADLYAVPNSTTATTIRQLPPLAAFTTADGCEAVVLGTASDLSVEVFQLGAEEIFRYSFDRPVTEVADPAERLRLLAHVLAAVDSRRHNAVTSAQVLRDEHTATLGKIRAYAIDRHKASDICREGLNDFLKAFGLPLYQPRLRIRFTLTGSYEVDHSDEDTARDDARGYLKPDVDDLDHVDHSSLSYDLEIDHVEELDDEN